MGGSETVVRTGKLPWKTWAPPLTILLLILIAFGPIIPALGFYWDDWPTAWFLHFRGPAGFPEIFSIDRPLLGYLVLATTSLVGEAPQAWQVFGLLTRWAAAVTFWWTLKGIWPQRSRQAAWAALLFSVYPGFQQQPLSLTYSHSWIILAVFLLSMGIMVRAVRRSLPGPPSLWLWGAWILATWVLFTSEYFFGLELLRPVVLALVLMESGGLDTIALRGSHRDTLMNFGRKIISIWAPYLVSILIFLYWRLILHPTPRGEVQLFDQAGSTAGGALPPLIVRIVSDLAEAGGLAWTQTFNLRRLADLSPAALLGYGLVVLAAGALALLFALKYRPDRVEVARLPWGVQAIGGGLLALFFTGWPFWITGLPIALSFPFDRFMIAMIVGACLLAAGLVDLIPGTNNRIGRRGGDFLKAGVLAILVGLAAGSSVYISNIYRLEWEVQKEFFWQLAWRAPALEPGTTLLTSEMPHLHSSDYTLSAPLNWMYYPGGIPEELPYLITDMKARRQVEFAKIGPEQAIQFEYRTSSFAGNTSKAIVLFYDPPRCLKVMDPSSDRLLPRKPLFIDVALPLSQIGLITGEDAPAHTPPSPLGPEPAHGWCYYFQKAELARQNGDWQRLVELGDEARRLHLRPGNREADEWAPFIAGYGMAKKWQIAVELTSTAYEANPKTKDFFCSLWLDLLRKTAVDSSQQAAKAEVKTNLGCQFP